MSELSTIDQPSSSVLDTHSETKVKSNITKNSRTHSKGDPQNYGAVTQKNW